MATYYVISRADDSSAADVRLVESDLNRIYHHGSKSWEESNAWWTLVNEVLPDASSPDNVSVKPLVDELKSLIQMAEEVIEGDDDEDRAEAKAERDHLLAAAARLIEMARTAEPWVIKDEQDDADRSISEEEYHEIADQIDRRA